MSDKPALRVLIQSRLSSSRLPAKALLAVRDTPSVVLCARRAANTGLSVVVVTSEDPSDDPIARALARFDIPCHRGSLHDVLARFASATADMSDDGWIVRLTADNLFPDGAFIEQLFDHAQRDGRHYLGTSSPADGLPYGLSAEIFTVEALRRAHKEVRTGQDKEHVTPWIRRTYCSPIFKPDGQTADRAHLRCTMDTFEDFLRVSAVFEAVAEPVSAPWEALVERLEALSEPAEARIPSRFQGGQRWAQMTLGTVQLGMRYGAANTAGQPSEALAEAIVATAWKRGITHLDCAAAYGSAETRVGRALSKLGGGPAVITKLSPLASLAPEAPPDTVERAVWSSVHRSCHALGLRRLPVLMLHRWSHHKSHGGAIWQHLLSLQALGVVGALGASVQSPEEALEALVEPRIEVIQMPFNLLDWRWKAAGVHTAAASRPDVAIHARSALLQGILVCGAEVWPALEDQPAYGPQRWVDRVAALTGDLGRESAVDLCLAFVRSQPWITSAVVGVETQDQLDENCRLFATPMLTAHAIEQVEAALAGAPEPLLDPSRWS